MKKNFKHVLLGTFIDESLKCANLTMTHLCKETGMGKASYENIKWTLRYLWYRKKREEEEGGNENTRVR